MLAACSRFNKHTLVLLQQDVDTELEGSDGQEQQLLLSLYALYHTAVGCLPESDPSRMALAHNLDRVSCSAAKAIGSGMAR